MEPITKYIVIGVGLIFAALGTSIFFLKKHRRGQTEIDVFGFRLRTTESSLVIFLAGVFMIIYPLQAPIPNHERVEPIPPIEKKADLFVLGRDLQWCNSLGDENFNYCTKGSIDTGYPCGKVNGKNLIVWSRKNGGGDIGIEIPHHLKTKNKIGVRATFNFKILQGRAKIGIDEFGKTIVVSSNWKNSGFDDVLSIDCEKVRQKGRWAAVIRLDKRSTVEIRHIELNLL